MFSVLAQGEIYFVGKGDGYVRVGVLNETAKQYKIGTRMHSDILAGVEGMRGVYDIDEYLEYLFAELGI